MRKSIIDWNAVQHYYDEGHGFRECLHRFGFCHAAWKKAIGRGALRIKPSRFNDGRRRYDWTEIQIFYDKGHTHREAAEHFGFWSATWDKAIQRGDIRVRPRRMSIEELLAGKKRSRNHIKARLFDARLLQQRCQECNLDTWRGRPVSMHLDHINGIKNDNRLENLRMLCPNCHSQTPTYGGRNRRLRRLQEGQAPV